MDPEGSLPRSQLDTNFAVISCLQTNLLKLINL
jgi:hypothetical protein